MILTITVTKEILEASKNCGDGLCFVGKNCAIALAVRDIFPKAYVDTFSISVSGVMFIDDIFLPNEATAFIRNFDTLSPEKRVQLPEFSFDVDIPDSIIEQIDISEISKLLEGHPTLKLQTV